MTDFVAVRRRRVHCKKADSFTTAHFSARERSPCAISHLLAERTMKPRAQSSTKITKRETKMLFWLFRQLCSPFLETFRKTVFVSPNNVSVRYVRCLVPETADNSQKTVFLSRFVFFDCCVRWATCSINAQMATFLWYIYWSDRQNPICHRHRVGTYHLIIYLH